MRLQKLGYFQELLPKEQAKLATWLEPTTPLTAYEDMLGTVSQWLAQECGQPAVILIDEYDALIHSAHVGGCYDEAIAFFRNFLTDGLKDNPHLFRGILSGILRIAKEGLFSGLNNLEVLGILDSRCAAAFGFTEDEVEQLAAEYGIADQINTLRSWYNGYRFGGDTCQAPITLYNPWSILHALHRPHSRPEPYWVNTSDNILLREMLVSAPGDAAEGFIRLLQGQSVSKPLKQFLVLPELDRDPDALWNFLLMAGYLRLDDAGPQPTDPEENPPAEPSSVADPFTEPLHALTIPNYEVTTCYRDSFLQWLKLGIRSSAQDVHRWCQALLRGAQEFAQEGLQRPFTNTLSYHDTAPAQTPEAVYQAFVKGLLVNLQAIHRIRSNRESGFGRYDVIIAPKQSGGPGAVLEFKRVASDDDSAVSAALDQAIEQIRAKRYATNLSEAGASPQHAIAIACHGKQVWLRAQPLNSEDVG